MHPNARPMPGKDSAPFRHHTHSAQNPIFRGLGKGPGVGDASSRPRSWNAAAAQLRSAAHGLGTRTPASCVSSPAIDDEAILHLGHGEVEVRLDARLVHEEARHDSAVRQWSLMARRVFRRPLTHCSHPSQ
jgi:hypothetical protein